MRCKAAVTVLALLLGGCLRSGYFVSGTTPEAVPHVDWRSHLLWGAIDLDRDLDLRELCPQGVARVENELELFNVIFFLLTAGIYASTTVDVYCQAEALVVAPPPVAPPPAAGPPSTSGVPVVEQRPGDAQVEGPASVTAPETQPVRAAP